MVKFIKVNDSDDKFHIEFVCPECNVIHVLNNQEKFDGNYDSPTVNDETVVRYYGWDEKNKEKIICHSTIKNGEIKFLEDCSHKLKK